MTEWQKAQAGFLYDANYDEELIRFREKCADLCYAFNQCRPSDAERKNELLHCIFGEIRGEIGINAPFYCDYGFNIFVGRNFFANYNCVILDGAKVTFGDNVFIAPNCTFTTAGHPLDVEQRNQGLEIALPITVGDNVWFGANVCVLPGVTIGSGSVIAAGSVVNRDIPSGVLAGGVPCRVIRTLTEQDREKYPRWK